MANGELKIQIETKKNHELFISNQAITDFKLANVRTAVIQNEKTLGVETPYPSFFTPYVRGGARCG